MNDAFGDASEVEFTRETGEQQPHTVEVTGEVLEFPVTEDFTVNLSGYSLQRTAWLPSCFTSAAQPRFAVLPLIIEFGLRIPAVGDRTIWEVSQVSFSPDGRRAVFYAEHFCGGLCAGGAHFLYEFRDGAWNEIGYRVSWVS